MPIGDPSTASFVNRIRPGYLLQPGTGWECAYCWAKKLSEKAVSPVEATTHDEIQPVTCEAGFKHALIA
jgi:hypothetical protein